MQRVYATTHAAFQNLYKALIARAWIGMAVLSHTTIARSAHVRVEGIQTPVVA